MTLLNRFDHFIYESSMAEIETAMAERLLARDGPFMLTNIDRLYPVFLFWYNNDFGFRLLAAEWKSFCCRGVNPTIERLA